MTFESKLEAFNKALSELQGSQRDIKDTLRQTCDIWSLTSKTVESVEAIDRVVTDLEIQIHEQSCLIKQITQLALKLEENVNDLTSKLNRSSYITRKVTKRKVDKPIFANKVRNQTENQTCVNQHITGDTSSFNQLHLQSESGSSWKRKSFSEKHDVSKVTVSHKSTDQKREPNTRCPNSFQTKTCEEVKIIESSIRHETTKLLTPDHCKRTSNVLTARRSDKNHDQHYNKDKNSSNLKSQEDRAANEDKTNTTKIGQQDTENGSDTQKTARFTVQTTDNLDGRFQRRRARRNDFGYKQIRCDTQRDNRVRFHGKQQCFQGDNLATDTDSTFDPQYEPNIRIDRQSTDTDSLLAEALSQEDTEQRPESGGTSNSKPFDKPKTFEDWLHYADEVRVTGLAKCQAGLIQRGNRGHIYVLVLDCSARMDGQKFSTMINTVKTYINGIKEIAITFDIHDNIGLAVFGEMSTVIVEPTCDYDKLLQHIDKLKPYGDAPLIGGLLMGLAGVLGSGRTTTFLDFQLQGCFIVFTDSLSENVTITPSLNPAYNFLDAVPDVRLREAVAVITNITVRGVKIYYVPVEENSKNQIMEIAIRQTNGKVVKTHEIYRLVRMTQTLYLASNVALNLRFQRSPLTREIVQQRIIGLTSPYDQNEDCIDLILELADPIPVMVSRGLYTELKCRTLSLGDRVKHRPDLAFGAENLHFHGTVVGQNDINLIWVRWDNELLDTYLFDERIGIFHIEKIRNYRTVMDGIIAVGCRVERGSDWTYDNEDGGRGCQGTVLSVQRNDSAIVRWDCRTVVMYRMGQKGLFEIKLSEDSCLTTSHADARVHNPDIDNEDDVQFDEYIIPTN